MRHLYRQSDEECERFCYLFGYVRDLRMRNEVDNLEKLNDTDTYVTKIGGDNAGSLRENYERIQERNAKGKKQVIVVSAIRSSEGFRSFRYEGIGDLVEKERDSKGFNTTSHLIATAKLLQRGEKATALEVTEKIESFTQSILGSEVESEFLDPLRQVVTTSLNPLKTEIDDFDSAQDVIEEIGSDWLIRKGDGRIFSIAGVGEMLACAVYQEYFRLKKLNSRSVDLDHDIYETAFQEELGKYRHKKDETDEEAKAVRDRIEAAEARVVSSVKAQVADIIEDADVVVAGGYAPVIASQRGYSDKMGAYMAQVASETLQEEVAYLIEKEFPIMSGDPRIVKWAKVVRQMTYDFAAEVFGSKYGADAGAVQEEALDILSRADIDAFIFNPNRMERCRISRISNDYHPTPNGAEMIGRKKVPNILQIKSNVMNEEGIVDIFTQWFRENKVRIDHIATSSNTISFTFNNGDFSEDKRTDLERFLEQEYPERFTSRVLKDQALLYCMGNNMQRPGVALQATLGMLLSGADIHLITQGVNERVMVFAVDEDVSREALQKMHQTAVEVTGREVQFAKWLLNAYVSARSRLHCLLH